MSKIYIILSVFLVATASFYFLNRQPEKAQSSLPSVIKIAWIGPLTDNAKILGEDPPGSGRLSLEIWCENQDKVQLAIGKASCLLESEQSHHG